MAIDEVDENSVDRSSESSEKEYKPESDEVKSAYADRVVELATEKSQRVLDYLEDKARDTSSWGMLKDLRLSIVDGGKSITSNQEKAAEAGKTSSEDAGKTESRVTAVGDRSQDSGVGTLDAPQVERNDINGVKCVSQYTLPDGGTYKIQYGEDGKPYRLTIPGSDGRPAVYTKNGYKWVSPDDPDRPLRDVEVDDKGNVSFVSAERPYPNSTGADSIRTTLGADGSFAKSSEDGKRTYSQINITDHSSSSGSYTTRTYAYENWTKPDSKKNEIVTNSYTAKDDSGRVVTRMSHISELKSEGEPTDYKVTDDHGHVTTIDKNPDGTVTVKRGDNTETYDDAAYQDGKLTLKNKDCTVEINNDGTEIRMNADNQITEIINSDGEKTKFTRSGKNVTGVTCYDSQGKELRKEAGKVEIREDGSYTIALPRADLEARKSDRKAEVLVDGKKVDGGPETGVPVKLERRPDGTERLLDKADKHVTSDADRLISHYQKFTPEQERQLRQDLADIDRLPKEQRERIYASMDKIVHNDDLQNKDLKPKMELTGQQSRELVSSLAHQIAHPESIKQGCHGTCAAASIEQRTARDHPDKYAEIVASLATEGEYKTDGQGNRVMYAEKHGRTLDPKSDAYGQRSYTSELFQDAAVDLAVRMEGEKQNPPVVKSYKSISFDSLDIVPRPDDVTPSTDSGERVYVHNPNPGWPQRFRGLTPEQEKDVLAQLSPKEKYEDRSIETASDLEKAFNDNGQKPMGTGIKLGVEDKFTGMSDNRWRDDYHAVVVTHIGVNKKGQKVVYYENPAGAADHSYPNGEGVPIDDFVETMKHGEGYAMVRTGR